MLKPTFSKVSCLKPFISQGKPVAVGQRLFVQDDFLPGLDGHIELVADDTGTKTETVDEGEENAEIRE